MRVFPSFDHRKNSMKISCIILIISSLYLNFVNAQEAQSQRVKNDVALIRLTENMALYTAFMYFNSGFVPMNGLIINTKQGLVMVDAPWSRKHTKYVLKKARKMFKKRVKYAILTCGNPERIGGISELHRKKVISLAQRKTAQRMVENGFLPPDYRLDFQSDTTLYFGKTSFEIYFPGAGYSPDNITVYLPNERILFGGGLIKSATSRYLGNTRTANLPEWEKSIQKLYDKYPYVRVVIPAQGRYAGFELIKHSFNLVKRGY